MNLAKRNSSQNEEDYDVVSTEMCHYCFDILINHLNGRDCNAKVSFPNSSHPLFVTWEIEKGRHKSLRGCIGTFTPLPLVDGLKEYALASAIRDSRFPPISLEETSQLHVTVSILTNFETGLNFMDWQIGLHGIMIRFKTERGQQKSATYLPHVVLEQGWNHVETIDSLLRKGGYKGAITPDVRKSIRLTRYQSEIRHLSYKQYIGTQKSRASQLSLNSAHLEKSIGMRESPSTGSFHNSSSSSSFSSSDSSAPRSGRQEAFLESKVTRGSKPF